MEGDEDAEHCLGYLKNMEEEQRESESEECGCCQAVQCNRWKQVARKKGKNLCMGF